MLPSTPLVDTHCHLAAKELEPLCRDMIARAQDAGVVAAVVMGEHYEDNLRVLDLAARQPDFVRPALGHHPWHLDRAASDVARTIQLLEDHRTEVVAVGEVGLDYRAATTPEERANQRAVLTEMVEVARRLELPLSLHVRSAGHYVIELLESLDVFRASLHAFDGKARYAVSGASHGLFFSIPGTVLVSEQKRKLARALPLEQLLLESDAPALSPIPGRPSEPALVAQIVAAIAELRGIDREVVAEHALAGAKRLFRLTL